MHAPPSCVCQCERTRRMPLLITACRAAAAPARCRLSNAAAVVAHRRGVLAVAPRLFLRAGARCKRWAGTPSPCLPPRNPSPSRQLPRPSRQHAHQLRRVETKRKTTTTSYPCQTLSAPDSYADHPCIVVTQDTAHTYIVQQSDCDMHSFVCV